MVENVNHIPDQLLERYAMRSLPKLSAERVEEHLFFCSSCQERLQCEVDFASAMAMAAAKFRKVSGSFVRRGPVKRSV